MRRALILAGLTAALAAPVAAEFRLTILHVNDLHSRIEPINRFGSTCAPEDDAAGACFGGVARLATAVAARREAADAPVLLLDAGDQFQGSLFHTTYKGRAAAEFMNRIGFDAMAVGNHEFDDGPETLAEFIEAVDFPVISGNTFVRDEPALRGRLPGYVILEAGGERVGVVSVLAPDTAETSSPGPNVAFSDPIRYLQSIVPEIEAQGVDKIVALAHVGLPMDREIAAAAPGIDLIVGGHSHTLLSNEDPDAAGPYPVMVANLQGGETPIVQAYAYSKYLGEITLTFDESGAVTAAEGGPILLDASFAPDAEIAERVAALAAPIEDLKQEVIGEATAPIDGDRASCRSGECAMGVLVTDAMLAATDAEIAIQNGGGLRASIDAGPVTMGEVLTVLPFQNTIATLELTGAGIVEALENGVSAVEEGAGRFPQVGGMRYAWDPSAAPGSRIVSVEVAEDQGWIPIDRDATYSVVTNNFMRKGGDGYAVFADRGRNAYDFGPGLETATADYIAANTPYTPRLEGRVRRIEPAAEPSAEADADASEAVSAETGAAEPSDAAATTTEEAEKVEAGPAEATEDAAPASEAEIYVVTGGDTLWTIASRELGAGARWREIAEANDLSEPFALSPGMELVLPR